VRVSTRRALFESTLALVLLACEQQSASVTSTGTTGGAAGDLPLSAGGAEAGPAAGGGDAGSVGGRDVAVAGSAGDSARGLAGGSDDCGPVAAPNAWASWALPDPENQGSASAQHYAELSADLVLDSVTQLTWQRRLSDLTYSWDEARSYCACLTLGGYDDWQVPSRVELVSIVDFTRQDPALDPVAFPDTPFEWFWSSSTVAGEDGLAWYVAFWDGNTHSSTTDSSYRVRCVRHAEGSGGHFVVASDGTVADARTGLSWQRAASDAQLSWTEAQTYCSTLPLAGGGFRLPNMKELQSLVDEGASDPAIDEASFPNTPSEGFWAATPLSGTPTAAWFVSFSSGISYNSLIERTYRARCVR
jgi:hypothetical protein